VQRLAAVVVCLILTPTLISANSSSGRIPSRIPSADGPDSEPAWLSAQQSSPKGETLTQDTLPPRVKSLVEQELREGTDKRYGCIYYGPSSIDHVGPIPSYATLKDLALNSKAALKGTITDIDHGFSVFGPSSLLEIQVDEWLKKSDKVTDRSFVYLVYPVAQFEAGGHRFCKADDARWGNVPQVGDELLVFPYRVALDESRQVLLPDPDGYEVILFRKQTETLSLPKFLKNDPDTFGVKNLETLKSIALGYIEKAGAPKPPPAQ
jgi:hypothetical protein